MGIMHMRTLPAGFIAPCLPTKTDKLPSGSDWLHEIKHDGFRIIARKNGARVRLYSSPVFPKWSPRTIAPEPPYMRVPEIPPVLPHTRAGFCLANDTLLRAAPFRTYR